MYDKDMKKEIWILILLSVVIVVLLGFLIFVPKNYEQDPSPLTGTEGLVITSLISGQEVSSPLEIVGQVRGNGWSGFEGQVGTVRLLDNSGKELAATFLPATTEWTALPTNFVAILNFQSLVSQSGTLVFRNENPSGDPVRDKTFSLPIKISANKETMVVNAYFGKDVGEQDYDCSKVFFVDRVIPKTVATAKASLEELLNGPTEAEKAQGYFTSIPAGSKPNSISIVDGQALVDFNEATESGGGSCSMASRTAQITKTLLQFPTVTSVKLSINGRTQDIFQP